MKTPMPFTRIGQNKVQNEIHFTGYFFRARFFFYSVK